MHRKTCVQAAAGLLVGAASCAFGQDAVLLDKAELVTHAAQGFSGADASAIMASAAPGATLYGANCVNGTFRLADDFVIPAGETWTIDKLTFFAYQTNALNPNPPVSTFTLLTVQLTDGPPPAGAVLFGDQTTNRLTASSWSGIYRTTDGDIGTAFNRAPIRLEATLAPPLVLGAGTYWLNWGATGTVASGPWTPPETRGPTHATPGPVPGNGLQFQGAPGWVASVNGTSGIQNSWPFIIEGTKGGGCYPDCTGEGTLTVADFGCFQGKYVLGDMYADCSGDGVLAVGDFGCFQGKYVLGCP